MQGVSFAHKIQFKNKDAVLSTVLGKLYRAKYKDTEIPMNTYPTIH